LKDNKLVFDFWLVLVTPHICYQKWWWGNTTQIITFEVFGWMFGNVTRVSILGTYVLCKVNAGKELELSRRHR
jgi:hypothetical protein